jgi:hypothetical protein
MGELMVGVTRVLPLCTVLQRFLPLRPHGCR